VAAKKLAPIGDQKKYHRGALAVSPTKREARFRKPKKAAGLGVESIDV